MAHSGLLLVLLSQVFMEALTDVDTCGGHLNSFPGYMTTAGFPMAYLPSQQCLWVISAPNSTQKIVLNFNSLFDLGDKQCKNDYVEVYDGRDELSPMLGRFCGSVAPSPLISSGSEVVIKFVTDDENSDQAGFSVRYDTYQQGPDCSRNFTDTQGVITTPNFPKKYPNNINCTFMILAPQNSEIELEFSSFSMEPASIQSVHDIFLQLFKACKFDRVEIWDGLPAVGSFIGEYCGSISPHHVISYSGILSMIVTTDDNIAGEGFSANYTIRERSASSGDQSKYTCGGHLNSFPGYMTTAGFPMAYLPSQQCLWVISAPKPTQKIVLNFNSLFDLGDKQCKNDYVEVYDGGDELSPMLGRFCGSVAPSPLISSGNEVVIKFVTDDENSDQAGFSVRYDTYQQGPDCSRNFTDTQGVITTPNFPKKYPNNINCTFMIFAPNTSEIMLEFTSFNMEYFIQDGDSCSFDWLEIWDGLPAVGSRIGKYCGSTSPDPVVSRSSVLSMMIVTDQKLTREGFSANYTIRDRKVD